MEGRICVPFNIEPEYLNPIIVLSLDGFLPGIELLPFVNILATGIASPARELETQSNKGINRVLA